MGNSPCDYDENGNPEILGQPVVIPNNIIYCYIFLAGFTDTKSPIFEINQIIDNSNRSYLTGSKC